MNTKLRFVHQITGWVKLELEQLQAAVQAGWDVEHHRDGTHGALTADSVATDAISAPSGTLTIDGAIETDGVWDDVVIPAVSVNPTGIASAMSMITDTAAWLGALLAVNTGTPTAVFYFQLPHATKLGEDIKFHIHWVKDDASDNTGTVVWQAQFRHLPLIGTASAWSGYSNGTLVVDPGDVANKDALTTWTLANSTYNFGISDILAVTLQRNGGTSGDAVLLSADLHLKKCRLGSASENSL